MSGLFGSTTIKGTRITDFAKTSADVGNTIPFLYGRAPVTGNVIFAALPPKENRQVKRQGKGGVKQETFTYTTSYAISFCRGPIQGYWWVKRNGKVVYSQDPAAPIEDKDYAAKWAAKVMMYNGTSSQMPNSMIESYKGSGRVSAFKYLAYIAIPNEDVTEGGGAIPSYEAVPIASPSELWLTSKPYPQYCPDQLKSTLTVTGGELRTVLHFGDISPDKLIAQLASTGGEIKDPPNGIFKDGAASTLIARGGELKLPRAQRMAPDAIENALIANGGELLIPPSGTMESDSVDGALVATGGELLSGWAVSALYELPYENPGWSGVNFRLRIPAADMPAGTKVRLTLRGASSEGFKVTTAHFGRAATSGDPYDFASAPTQVKFGGANSVTIAATAAIVTDEITMTITGTNDYLLAVYCNDGNNDVMPYGGSFGGQAYYRAASNQSSTTNVSGYTNWGGVAALVEKIEIYIP